MYAALSLPARFLASVVLPDAGRPVIMIMIGPWSMASSLHEFVCFRFREDFDFGVFLVKEGVPLHVYVEDGDQ